MRPKIILTADNLGARDVATVRDAVGNWGTLLHLPQESPEVPAATQDADVAIGWTGVNLLRESKVTTYLCGSAGIDAYVRQGLDRKPQFRMTNAAGVMSVTIAEHCVAMMFALVRQIPVMVRQQIDRHYARRWHGGEVAGRTACIVGLGASGTELARRLAALGMTVTGVRRSGGELPAGVSRCYAPDQLHAALTEADHVFCLLPGGPATKHTFDASTFEAMRPGTFFYNASRGTTVDEAAITARLVDGHLAGAGLDVFESEPLSEASPLWDLPSVLITFHSAGHSALLAPRLASLFATNLKHLRAGLPLINVVGPELLR